MSSRMTRRKKVALEKEGTPVHLEDGKDAEPKPRSQRKLNFENVAPVEEESELPAKTKAVQPLGKGEPPTEDKSIRDEDDIPEMEVHSTDESRYKDGLQPSDHSIGTREDASNVGDKVASKKAKGGKSTAAQCTDDDKVALKEAEGSKVGLKEAEGSKGKAAIDTDDDKVTTLTNAAGTIDKADERFDKEAGDEIKDGTADDEATSQKEPKETIDKQKVDAKVNEEDGGSVEAKVNKEDEGSVEAEGAKPKKRRRRKKKAATPNEVAQTSDDKGAHPLPNEVTQATQDKATELDSKQSEDDSQTSVDKEPAVAGNDVADGSAAGENAPTIVVGTTTTKRSLPLHRQAEKFKPSSPKKKSKISTAITDMPAEDGFKFWSSYYNRPIFKVRNQHRATFPPYMHYNRPLEFPDVGDDEKALYNDFFDDFNRVERIETGHITAKCGNSIRVEDLECLKPGMLTKSTLLDTYLFFVCADLGVGVDGVKSVAVFHSAFLDRLVSNVNGEERYNYENARATSLKCLQGKCPLDFEVLLFYCYLPLHWQVVLVYPNQRLIEVMDSAGSLNQRNPRLIFRWLYDELKYYWPARFNTAFGHIEDDYGWKLRNGRTAFHGRQDNCFDCGIYAIAFASCVLAKRNPSLISPRVIGDLRIRMFTRFFPPALADCSKSEVKDVRPLDYTPPFWIGGTGPIRLPSVPVISSHSSEMRVMVERKKTIILYNELGEEVELNPGKGNEGKTQGQIYREAQKVIKALLKSGINRRKQLVNDRINLKHRQRNEAAKEAKAILDEGLRDMLKRKGSTVNKNKVKKLKEAFPATQVHRAVIREDTKDRKANKKKTTGEDNIAQLKYVQGYSGLDPPTANSVNGWVPQNGQKVFKYNHFVGMGKDGSPFPGQLNPEWCEMVFSLVFTSLVRAQAGSFIFVPIGSSKNGNKETSMLWTNVKTGYIQGTKDFCLTYSVASALEYLGLYTPAYKISLEAHKLSNHPGNSALDQIKALMKVHVPLYGGCQVFNISRKGKPRKLMDIEELIEHRSPYLTIVQPIGNDGLTDHVVTVVDDLVFDARLGKALRLTKDSFDWVCGEKKFRELGAVYRYNRSYGAKSKKVVRKVKCNW